ncbi:MAG: U32 family peptidase [Atopobiaceae bacterium]|nr:U32 family peptidase [Atopobiaceae bacterium]
MELLAPAGGPEQLNAAIAAGTDAIYCGFGHHFNARRGATSFDDETFAEACRRAHLAGVRIYVTVNVVIKSSEMTRALALIRRAWLLGADAFIIQDWGLLDEVARRWPQIEIHVSTQANVHDTRGVAWSREHGASRVTLSRELSLPEIATIAGEGVELEGFAHGALCFCYSGICQMSSMAGDRSANRGACAQPCRLPYQLVDGSDRPMGMADMRPLCPKDYRTIGRLGELRDAGLGSLKLEGRLKGSDYVYAVVRSYRAALDELEGRTPELSASQRERLLRRAFNRDFTDAYLDGRSDNSMMSYERSNNRGELVGTVVATRDLGSSRVWRGGTNGGRERTRKVTLAEVDVRLDEPVGKGDLLEIRPIDDPSQFLTAHADRDAKAGETLVCRTARPMAAGCPVRVIRSQSALDVAARAARADVPRQRDVNVKVTARVGQPFTVELSCTDGSASAVAYGFLVDPARTRSVTEQDLIDHVGRMGGSAFRPVSYDIDLDEGCGMRFSDVHKVRAEACRSLARELLAPYEARSLDAVPSEVRFARDVAERSAALGAAEGEDPVEVCALVADVASYERARAAGATRIYATTDAIRAGEWPEGAEPIPWLDEVCREIDHNRLDRFVRADSAVAVGSVSELALAASVGALPEVEPCIPVHNPSAAMMLAEAGARCLWFSAELSMPEILAIAAQTPVATGLVVYGRTRAMTSEHCVLQAAGKCIEDCARCALRRQDMAIVSAQGKRFPVRTDLEGRSRIYASEVLDAVPEVGELIAGGVRRLMVDGTLLEPTEVGEMVARLARAVKAARRGAAMPGRLSGCTAGHLHREID